MDRCPAIADLARILGEATTHPERRHLADCPRCRTLARRFADFLDPTPLPDEAEATEASLALQERLRAALPRGASPAPGTPRRAAGRRPVRRHWYAMAAVVVLALGLFSIRQQLLEPGLPPGRQAPVLRGVERDLPAPQLDRTAAGLRVAWTPHPQSDGAVIVVLDAELREVKRLAVTDRGEHVFAVDAAGGGLPAASRYLRVRFEQEGDEIGSTPLVPLPRADS